MKIFASHFHSPLGEMLLLATEAGLKGVYFSGQRYLPAADPEWLWDNAPLAAAKRSLDAYFAGDFREPLPALHSEGTPFRQQVWAELRKIPAGQTCSYGEIARRLDAPKAVRAVAAAIGRNPVSILVPCHRVVGKDRSLTGYAGGLDRKAWLLAHEQAPG